LNLKQKIVSKNFINDRKNRPQIKGCITLLRVNQLCVILVLEYKDRNGVFFDVNESFARQIPGLPEEDNQTYSA